MREQMVAFDTYTHINELKKVGFEEEQAAGIIKSLMDSRSTDISHLATKEQLSKVKSQLTEQISEVKSQLTEQISEVKSQVNEIDKKIEIYIAKLETKIAENHSSTLRWMVGTMIAFVSIMLAVIKLL